MIPVHNVKKVTKRIHTQLPEVMNIHPHVMKLETLWEIHVSMKIPNDISTVLLCSCLHIWKHQTNPVRTVLLVQTDNGIF